MKTNGGGRDMKAPRYRDLKLVTYFQDEVEESRDVKGSFLCPYCHRDEVITMDDYARYGLNLRKDPEELPDYERTATICLCTYCQQLFAVEHRDSDADELTEDDIIEEKWHDKHCAGDD